MRIRGPVLGVLVVLSLLLTAHWIDWERLPINGLNLTLNDQVGYVSVARHWLDEGNLNSSIIYPSLLRQAADRNSLYMPGFYAELALTFRLLGYSALSARVPALLSFLLACGLVYWIARRLYDEETAIYGLALFAFFPMNLFYAFTAMAETPLTAVGLVAFSLFLMAPPEFRSWAGPLSLALPILFRETGVALGVVMCAMLLFSATDGRRKAATCGLLACVVLLGVLFSPAGSGRPSLWKANILEQGRFEAVYSDAFALQGVPGSPQHWIVAIEHKLLNNLYSLMPWRGLGRFEGVVMLFLLSGIPLGIWLWLRKRDAFALGVAAALSLLAIADLCLYTVRDFRGVRSLLMMEPFVAVLWGLSIESLTRDKGSALRNLPVLLCFLVGVSMAMSTWRTQGDAIAQAQEDTSFLKSVIGESKQMVVSPYRISLDYVNEHYPQRWAFVPANCQTMRLLDEREGIGTLIMPAESGFEAGPSLCGTRLKFDGEKVWRGRRYRVFRNQKDKAKATQ